MWSIQRPRRIGAKKTYQEERIGHESVSKDGPADHSSSSLTAVGNCRNGNGDDDADELVARVGDQVVNLAFGVDVEEIPSQPEQDELEDDDHTGVAECYAEQLGLEFTVETGDHGGQQDVRRECHDGDVHVGAVDVISWR